MPAPLHNSNALTHGLCAGKLPAGCAYVKRLAAQLQRTLEAEVLDVRGEIGVYEAATIQSAVRWEKHALLSQRWLRLSQETLTPEQRLAFSREIARASTERDKCLERLDIGRGTSSPSPFRAPDGRSLPDLVFGPRQVEQAPGATPEAPEGDLCRRRSNLVQYSASL
jgi:hypothetical protein